MTAKTEQNPRPARRVHREPLLRRQPSQAMSLLLSAVAAVALITLWWWASGPGGLLRPLFLSTPYDVATSFVYSLNHPYLGTTLGGHIMASLNIVLTGWIVAGLIGVPLGIWIGWSELARRTAYPVFQLLRPIPPIAWIPLALVWFGIGDSARVYVVFVSAIVPWILNSTQAVNTTDQILIRAARTLGATQTTILWRVVVRTGIPTLLAGAQIALGNAWTTVIAAELLGASRGLGFVALNASRVQQTDMLLVAMLVIGFIGATLSFLMRLLVRQVGGGSVMS